MKHHCITIALLLFCISAFSQSLPNPDGMIDLKLAPTVKFNGRIFLINDWDGGDKDNQNVGEELNRNAKIAKNIILLSDVPEHKPQKVTVDNLVTDAQVLADASKKGMVGIAMGCHSRHVLAWLTKLPRHAYNYHNIVVVTHSNWNELDGRAGYNRNKKEGDPDLIDTYGEDVRRGLYPSLAQISDLGVAIWEIPRTDFEPGGWGGKVPKSTGEATIKAFDISDLGLVYYFKTGKVTATAKERNAYVSAIMKKPPTLKKVDHALITKYWEHNKGVPGDQDDYRKK